MEGKRRILERRLFTPSPMFQRDQCLTCELFFGVDKRAVSKASNLVLTS
jgi:hypothetical protein